MRIYCILLFLMFTLVSCNSKTQFPYANTIDNFAKKMEIDKGLILNSFGHGNEERDLLIIGFIYNDTVNLEEAKNLMHYVVQKFLEELNVDESKKHKEFKNIEVELTFLKDINKFPKNGELYFSSQRGAEIRYYTFSTDHIMNLAEVEFWQGERWE